MNWFKDNYPDQQLPSIYCTGCPNHSHAVWKQLKDKSPKSFHDGIFIYKALRHVPSIKHTFKAEGYLDSSRTALAEVDFDQVPSYEDLILEDCEGRCGI